MEKLNIHPRVSVNTISSINWTLEQDIAFCTAAGIPIMNVIFSKLGSRPQDGIDAIRRAGLRTNLMSAGGGSLIDSGAKTLELLKPVIEAASELGCSAFYCVTGAQPERMTTDEAYARLVECIQPANAYAKEKGLRLAVEHTSTSTRHHGFIHTLTDAVDLSKDADIGITLELQNCWYERHLDQLFKDNVARFVVVQVSDFKVGEDIKFNRRVPGDGSMPLEWMLGLLLNAGYQGDFDIEVLGPSIEAEGYASAIRRSVDWLSERLRAWGV
jgi:sugar phosphate isomerase/epimerase